MSFRKGFTLIEVIVILAVIAILAAMAIPTAFRLFLVTASSSTSTEMQKIKYAMVGNPDLIAYDLRSDFGYLGDVGCLPSSLQDLITTPASVPVYTTNLAAQVAAQIGSGAESARS